MKKKFKKTDAVSILHNRYIGDDPEQKASVKEERLNAEVARQIYTLRKNAGMNQKQLAEIIGTTQSAISRLENADYEGHSLQMLSRIAKALDQNLLVQMKPNIDQSAILQFAFQRFMRDLRLNAGLSFEQLAIKININLEEAKKLEQDNHYLPDPMLLFTLSKFYNIPQRNLAFLAGVISDCPNDIQEEASKFAACSESFEILSPEEKKALDSFIKFLNAKTSKK